MNLSIVKTLDTRYVKKDGTSAIIIRIGRDNQTLPIPTGFSIPEKFWDEKKRRVKNGYDGVTSVERFNRQINEDLKSINDIALELEEAGVLESLPLIEIKKRMVKQRKGYSFFSFADEIIATLSEAKRIGTRNAYRDATKALENFNGDRNLSFKQITFELLTNWETYHLSKGNKLNGLAAYLRSIRAIYNLAINSGIIEEKYYPFKKYKIGTKPTPKRAIEKTYLNRIFSMSLQENHPCFHARNYFVISYALYGMNFYDIALLKKMNIVNGRIQYQRSKTSIPYNIKITPSIQLLLDYYVDPEKDYIFNIIKRSTAEHIDKDIKGARKRYNNNLREIAKLCGIETNLTSYVGRHSFATQATLAKVPLNVTSAMLGHKSLKTTEIYLASLPTTILDNYNELILI